MQAFKNILKSLLPKSAYLFFHSLKAETAALWYGYPSRELVVIGITGTKGKTSTANYVWSVLDSAGYTTGLIGTANIRIGKYETMNEYHMTMPDPFEIQKLLRKMVDEHATHVVMEVTSEGMKLSRHEGIDFDVAIFTNLTPEHLPSHNNSFEEYKKAKTELFKALSKSQDKTFAGRRVKKTIIVNADDPHGAYYLSFPAEIKHTYGVYSGEFRARDISTDSSGVHFSVFGTRYDLAILGEINIYNALPAIVLSRSLGLDRIMMKKGIDSLSLIPGRMEVMQKIPFLVIVDYAHEKISMNLVLDAGRAIARNHKVIVLLGAEGGGRDKRKRPAMGEAAGKKADYVIASNVDPYEDDPAPIAEDIARAAEAEGKIRGQNLFVILDRKEGMKKALALAKAGDVVIFTGKGAEQSMILAGKSIPWDDRDVVRELLANTEHRA